jgi:hypothetical protein
MAVNFVVRNTTWEISALRRSPPSFYVELVTTCKQLIERENLLDTTATNKTSIPWGTDGTVTIDARDVNFSDRMQGCSPRRVTVGRNGVLIEFKRRFVVWVYFLPFRGNKWEVTLGSEGGPALLWEGEDSCF